jgi:hypothetical protein
MFLDDLMADKTFGTDPRKAGIPGTQINQRISKIDPTQYFSGCLQKKEAITTRRKIGYQRPSFSPLIDNICFCIQPSCTKCVSATSVSPLLPLLTNPKIEGDHPTRSGH